MPDCDLFAPMRCTTWTLCTVFAVQVHRRLLFLKYVETVEVYVWLDGEASLATLTLTLTLIATLTTLAPLRSD